MATRDSRERGATLSQRERSFIEGLGLRRMTQPKIDNRVDPAYSGRCRWVADVSCGCAINHYDPGPVVGDQLLCLVHGSTTVTKTTASGKTGRHKRKGSSE